MKCWICGKEDAMMQYGSDWWVDSDNEKNRLKMDELVSEFDYDFTPRCFCKECFDKHKKQMDEIRSQYILLRKELMLERGIRMLERQAVNIYEYQDIIDSMSTYVKENPDKFDSSHEMVAAIVLVDNAIKAKPNYKIGKYKADFYIPEYKIVLEIDGELHSHNLYRDNQRDIAIRGILGSDWEVVRISTKYIETNAKALVDAMIAIKAEKQKIRKQHNGMLPEWYSSRNAARRKRAQKYSDDFLLS